MAQLSNGERITKAESTDVGVGFEVELGYLRICVISLAIVSVCVVLTALHPWGGWKSPTIITTIAFIPVLIYMGMRRDAVAEKFMLACLISGFLELAADWYIIVVKPTTMYMGGGPFIWESPLYMPFSWTIVPFTVGMISRWVDKRWGLLTATIVAGLLGLLMVPAWEHLAKLAGFWYYYNTPMIGNTPYYIMFGECIIFASLPFALRFINPSRWITSIGVGAGMGLWIFIAFWMGNQLFHY